MYNVNPDSLYDALLYHTLPKQNTERVKLEKFREDMIADMKAKGVNDKYFGEMKAIDVKKLLMK